MSTVAGGPAPVTAWVTRAYGAIGAQHVKIFAVWPRAGREVPHAAAGHEPVAPRCYQRIGQGLVEVHRT